jgi:hypothetical protein
MGRSRERRTGDGGNGLSTEPATYYPVMATAEGPERRLVTRVLTVIVAFSVFAAAGVLAWQALGPAGGPPPARVWEPGYPSPPATGYYVLFPDQAEVSPDQPFSAVVTALTNLPEGTLVSITTTNEGSCCPPVNNGEITFTTQDSSCYGLVGARLSDRSFTETITAQPDFLPFSVPGPIDPKPPEQPASVLAVLGQDFENLSGDQAMVQGDGSKRLVAKAQFTWPEPRCGGDPIPQFGGPECNPEDFQQQLQSHDLEGAMVDVMGAISQGRMCEFWSTMLPPDVEAEHPWPEFADQWRAWLMRQDFSDAGSFDWREGPLRWRLESRDGDRYLVDVIHGDQAIARLDVEPLPDYCPQCGPNVVPFWGIVGWSLQ